MFLKLMVACGQATSTKNKPQDITCLLALLAMEVFEKVTGRKVKVADSRYLQTGTETTIAPLNAK